MAGAHSWTSGAFVRGGNLGARRNLNDFPAVSALLAVVLRSACPDASFTSLALLTNQSAWVHRDLNNACGSLNTAIALSHFSQGGIWVQGGGHQACPQDSSLPLGVIHSFTQGVVQFDSHAFHCTQPWKGERSILVGFVVKGFQAFQPELIQALSLRAFNLPAIGTADIFTGPEGSAFPVVLEVFSGMGRLTAQLRSRGSTGSVAIDKAAIANPAAPKHLDVCANYKLLCGWLQSAHVMGVHLAPPLDISQPLAQAILAIVSEAVRLGHTVSIELPATATLWSSPTGAELLKLCPHHFEFCFVPSASHVPSPSWPAIKTPFSL